MGKPLRILFLAHLFPMPLDSGGKIKSYYTLKSLAGRHEVSVLAYVRTAEELAHMTEVGRICERLRSISLRRGKSALILDAARSLLANKSFIVSRDYRKAMQGWVIEELNQFQPDVVHIDHLQMAQFVPFGPGFKTVLDHHNVESMIVKRIGESPGSLASRLYARLEWPKLRRYELDVCRRCDRVLTVSEEDKGILVDLDPALKSVKVVPIGVDVHHFQVIEREPAVPNVLSVATMYWPPNVDSMLYFHDDIWPLVKARVPDCVLTIAGQKPVPAIQALGSDGDVRVTGYVSDSRDLARYCSVFIVPLRSGSGVRVKLLNAMAMGLPIVSTSIGAEGLDVVGGEHLLIADTPGEFAGAVVDLINDRELGRQLGENARALVCEKYSWETVGARLLQVYEELTG